MKLPDILSVYSKADRTTALAISAFLIATIALADARFYPGFSLGVFYLFPILVAALFVSRRELFFIAVICTLLREAFGPFLWDWGVAVRTVFGLLAFFGSGLFAGEIARRRRLSLQQVRQMADQRKRRLEAEEQLRVLIETSPAAIVTVDAAGRITLANQAAHQLLKSADRALTGDPIGRYLPVLEGVPHAEAGGRIVRTTLECRGRRCNGEVFLAHIWLSTYATATGHRLAAIVLDASEELRDREELGFDRLLTSSRILVRAVSHEIRNLCAAISVLYTNLGRVPGIMRNEDFQALGSLVKGLGELVSAELRPASDGSRTAISLKEVLEELRIVIEPAFAEEEASVKWEIPENLPDVYADRHGLLHVFMNLTSNSRRAMQDMCNKELTIAAAVEMDRVVVRVKDTGHGVPAPDQLFQPFQQAADGAGLGLYLSRALVRAFAGDLRHEPQRQGSCFAVELAPANLSGAKT